MNHRQVLEKCLAQVLAKLPDERVRQVLDFAEFLNLHEEQAMWSRPSPEELEELSGSDEDEYTEADARPEPNP
jgi:hypothetical protein